MSMDPERLAELRRVARLPVPGTSMAGCLNVHADHVRDLLADHDDLARGVERLREDSRIQGVILGDVGEALGSGVEESPVDAARRVRGERDTAQHEALRGAARDRIGQRNPGEAAVNGTAAYLAIERGWDHLKFEADAPEGEQPPVALPKMTRRLADLGASDLWKPFRVSLTGSGVIHTWEYQGRFEESFGGPEASRFTDENGETHNLHHPDWRVGPALSEGEQP